MKSYSIQVAILFTLVLFLQSCSKEKCTNTYTYQSYEPVYMDYDSFRTSVASEDPRSLRNPGKIYLFGGYLYINEINEGIHVIDNSNPAVPFNMAFIKIPGNVDIAVKNGILYADSYIDLVAIDILDPTNATELKRIEDIFPQRINELGYYADPENGIVIDWKLSEKTETIEIDCDNLENHYQPEVIDFGGGVMFDSQTSVLNSSTGGGSAQNPGGVAGSMARFTVSNKFLYAIDNSDLHLINIEEADNPVIFNKVNIGFNIETIFPHENKLFIGSQTGMHIYNILIPSSPQHMSTYEHIRSCDPVVVEDNFAYVTLRSGNACQGFTDQLDVIDISNLYSPTLLKTYPMYNPHGLGIDGKTLFICDGDAGLKVFDATDAETIDQHLLKHFGDINAFDVIPYGNILIMIGKDGFYQYDYSDVQSIQLISQIPII